MFSFRDIFLIASSYMYLGTWPFERTFDKSFSIFSFDGAELC